MSWEKGMNICISWSLTFIFHLYDMVLVKSEIIPVFLTIKSLAPIKVTSKWFSPNKKF